MNLYHKEMHHHHLRWWWGQTSPKEMLQGQTDPAAEAVWQSVSIRTRNLAHFSQLCSWISCAHPALPCLFSWQKNGLAKKGKFLCRFNELNYLTDLGWRRGKDDVQERSALSLSGAEAASGQTVLFVCILQSDFWTFDSTEAIPWNISFLKRLTCSSSASFKYVPEFMTVLVGIVSTELTAVLKEINHCMYSSLCAFNSQLLSISSFLHALHFQIKHLIKKKK